jgi:hypothetical protein
MPIPPLIDADDGAVGRKIVPLLWEADIKEGHPAVEKYNRRSTAIDFRVKLGAPYFDVTLGANRAIRIRNRGGKRKDSNENGAVEIIHGVSLGDLARP